MRPRKNIIGLVTHNLLVIEETNEVYTNKNKVIPLFLCRCKCGSEVKIRKDALLFGKTKSCGCIQKQHARANGKSRKLPMGVTPFNNILYNYKRRAKLNGVAFLLTENEFKHLTQQKCYYCGSGPSNKQFNGKDRSDVYIYNGLDKIDPSKGYTLDNVVTCCQFCNYAKSDWTKDFFLQQIEKIYETHCKK